MLQTAVDIAERIFQVATPILKIHRLDGPPWKRKIENNPQDPRIGPWLRAHYAILNESAWRDKGPCLYLVKMHNGPVRYVGISRNGVKHRWRTSPAYDAVNMSRLPEDQLFHSQCWRHIQAAASDNPNIQIEVRSLMHAQLSDELSRLGPPLSAFLALGEDGEGVCAAVERWLCNRSEGNFLSWNTSMTGKKRPNS